MSTMPAPALREIPFARPDFDEAEARAVAEVLASGWVTQGPAVARFEARFAERIGVAHAVATTSCTTALHLALRIAGVGPGDEVICPSYTFIATANAVLYVGATPVFADIDDATWNLDPADVARRVTARTKAVIVVHQVGLAADLDAVRSLTGRGIALIEDAACAVGATYRGRPVGAHGNVTCWSFHPRKLISTGEGGMLTTDDAEVAARARALRSFAASVSDRDRHAARGAVQEEYRELGYNYRMSDIQAAIGIEQLAKLGRVLERRRELARRYDAAFQPLRGVQTPARPPFAEHTFQAYGIRLGADCPVVRDDLLQDLVARGIACRRGIAPVHREPLYRERFGNATLPVTEEVAARSLFLPIFTGLSTDDQDRVIDAVTRQLR